MIFRITLLLLFPAFLVAQSKPNIIFILADDLGYGETSFTGTSYSTPNIDSLYHSGAALTNYHVRPICTASRYSLITGNYAFRDSFDYNFISQYDDQSIDPETETIAEVLKGAGYQTAIVGKWLVGNTKTSSLPMSQGFDLWYGDSRPDYESGYLSGVWNVSENGDAVYDSLYWYTDQLTDRAIDWMRAQAADNTTPFFLYLAPANPHDWAVGAGGDGGIPYKAADYALAPGGYSAAQKSKWANIYNLDYNVGRLIDSLEAWSIDSNTIVIFNSDNGASPSDSPDNGPYSGGKWDNREGGTRVPCVWYHPGTVDSMTVSDLTAIEDWLPTFASIAGTSPRVSVDGVDISPLIDSDTIPTRYWMGSNILGRMWSVHRDDWKLINNPTVVMTQCGGLVDDIKLYDLSSDPGETTDVSGANPSIVAELQAIKDANDGQYCPSLNLSAPGGWVNPPYWNAPAFYYDSDYYFQQSQSPPENN